MTGTAYPLLDAALARLTSATERVCVLDLDDPLQASAAPLAERELAGLSEEDRVGVVHGERCDEEALVDRAPVLVALLEWVFEEDEAQRRYLGDQLGAARS